MFRTLRDFIRYFDERNEVIRIKDPVSVDLEVAEVLRQLAYRNGPIAIFENIVERTLPIVGNLFGSWRRVELLIGADAVRRLDELVERMHIRYRTSILDFVKHLGELGRLSKYVPRIVSKASVKKVTWDEVDLTRIPAIRQWPLEPARFITFGITFVKHHDTVNFGYYRLQVVGKDRLIVHWMPWRRGREYAESQEAERGRAEIAIVFGPDPVTMLMAGVPIPHPLDKLLIASVIRGEGIELTRGEDVDVVYPAEAELVLEGYVERGVRALEGTFGDHAGFYSHVRQYPVVRVTRMMSREDPLIPVTVTGKPVLEDGNIIRFGEIVVLRILRYVFPEIVDLHMPPEGVGYLTIVSIRKRYPGHAKRVMMYLWSVVPTLNKIVIVTDAHVNVRDWRQVVYEIAVNVDPRRDVLIVPGYPVEELDPSSPVPGYGSKVGVDATRKLPEEYEGKEYPLDVEPSEDVVRRALSVLSKYVKSLGPEGREKNAPY